MKIAKYVTAHKFGNKGLFGKGSNQLVFKDMEKWSQLVKVASLLTTSQTCNELVKIAEQKYPEISEEIIREEYEFLLKNHYLMEEDDFDFNDRYSRSCLFYRLAGISPKTAINKLKNSTVAVVGCGGIGNYLSQMLAASGVGKILLVDNDIIEVSNLARQFLFCEEDVGKNKIDIIERELKKRNSSVEVEKFPLNINSKDDFKKINTKYDLLLLSADTPANIIYWTNDFCVENNVPYLNIGYVNDISAYGPFVIPGETSCFECTQTIQDFSEKGDFLYDEMRAINSNFKTASFPTVNATAASMALNDVFKFLCDYGEISSKNKRIGVHSLEAKIETLEVNKNKNCKKCSHL